MVSQYGLLMFIGGLSAASAMGAAVRIVSFGDSTTAPRPGVEVYSEVLGHALNQAGREVEVINSGVPGNTTAHARRRFDRDVLDRNPDVVVIQFGINDSAVDVWKTPPATQARVALDDYAANLTHFITTLRARGACVVLMTPNPMRWTPKMKEKYGHPPYDRERPDGFNANLILYARRVRELARKLEVPLVDVYSIFEHMEASGVCAVDELLLDGMHPNSRGHQVVARRLQEVLTKACECLRR